MSNTHIKLILAVQNNNIEEILTCLQQDASSPEEIITADVPIYEFICQLPLTLIFKLIKKLPDYFTNQVVAKMILFILPEITDKKLSGQLSDEDFNIITDTIKLPGIAHYLFTNLIYSKNVTTGDNHLLINIIGINQFSHYTDQNNYIFIIKYLLATNQLKNNLQDCLLDII